MASAPLPGSIVLTQIGGLAGKLVWLLQALNGDLSRWTHVAVALDDGTVFEAQPGGAVISPWSKYEGRQQAVVPWELRSDQRDAVVAEARSRVGTGYNWTTYFYLAAYRFRLPLATGFLRSRVARSDKMICSQAADDIYRTCGIHLFDDGRLPFDVTPGDLARLLDGRR
ncbi:hypothetical protein HW130_09905 [Streptomyces sp. PKU-EA00015]|uniref:hypothetical protein n=1 Tax=Streptomyces sp. PKU-EA00015 TaxID=2748326 RepID=UPI0015A273E4|nr:hypothetical protein [Streptomyces sp. PKU-EA00015]NWF26583.1 hypothetical protein [Streptomyces sp. PKU-EA00015]